MDVVRAATGWVVLAFLTFLGGVLVYLIATGRINLTKLVSEQNGDASMSRFQLLIFTFVIALCVLYVTVAPDNSGLPDIPTSVLTLLGISASSYAVGKGLQTQRDTTMKQLENPPVAPGAGGYRPAKLPEPPAEVKQ
jgi:hypothetical protein